ncbi:MAG: phosphatase PAP2 family protein [Candidatus Nanohaloarchaeota archaeon]|nr:phosphatase PAP2 family protein [Candidatus Nanohaloarchaeota archaeon]
MGGMTFFFAVSLSFYVLIILALYSAYKNKRFVVFFIGLVMAGIIGLALKYSLQIPRPSYEYLGINKWDKYAFPSMHALLSFYAGAYLGIFGLIWAGLIALSRVILQVHTTMDVLAGSILGLTLFYFFKNAEPSHFSKKEVVRKFIHLFVGVILFLAMYYLSWLEFLIVGISLLAGYVIAVVFPLTKQLYNYVKRKEKDLSPVALILSIILSYLLFGKNPALAGSIAVIGDGISPLIAIIINSKNPRSLRAAFLTSLLVFAGIYYLFKNILLAVGVSIIFLVIDYFNDKWEDNIILPLAISLVTWLFYLLVLS